jgi:polyketide biosynthesis enoyl-CoA hydratase PksH
MELNTALSVDVRLPESLTASSLRALAGTLETVTGSPARVVCLRGASEAVFCRGLALDSPEAAALPEMQEFAALLARLLNMDRPVLAIVDGVSLGGGVGLAAACDWVIATERATFGLPELLWGLLPALIWPVLTERMSPRSAKAWVLTAHTHPAQEAFAHGLVDEIVPIVPCAQIARRIRSLARVEPAALVRFRQWTRESRHLQMDEALPEGARITAGMLTHPVVLERLAAFRRGEAPWESQK